MRSTPTAATRTPCPRLLVTCVASSDLTSPPSRLNSHVREVWSRVNRPGELSRRRLVLAVDLTVGLLLLLERLHEVLHPPRQDAEQVSGRDHRGERGLRPAAPFQQSFREVGALPQLRDRAIDRASAGVEVAVPVAVATVDPVIGHDTVRGVADLVCVGQQRVDEGGERPPQQIRRGLRELLFKEAGRVDTGYDGIVVVPFERDVGVSSKNYAATVAIYSDTLTELPIHRSGGRNPGGGTTSSRYLLAADEAH